MAGHRLTLTLPVAERLARWATDLEPSHEDLALARRSLLDTVAITYAGRRDPRAPLFSALSEAGRWAALAHVLDYDDLHMPSTTHISAVCVPAALASGHSGDGADAARAYLAGAGVMARLGTALGWSHYSAVALPPGAPERPPMDAELGTKLELCAGGEAEELAGLTWESAAAYLRATLAD